MKSIFMKTDMCGVFCIYGKKPLQVEHRPQEGGRAAHLRMIAGAWDDALPIPYGAKGGPGIRSLAVYAGCA
jgi:hypothetical protein